MLVEDPTTPSAPTPGTVAPLIGRTIELARLRALVAGSAGSGDALLLSGDVGVGKTALLAVAGDAADADGLTVLSAAGREGAPDAAYSTLGRVLRPLRDRAPLLTATQRAALDDVWSRSASPSHHVRVLGAALALLRRAGTDRRVLVLVDDLQWVDEASALALAFTARRLVGSGVRFLAAARSGQAGILGGARVPRREVAPLDEIAAARLLGSRFPSLAPRVVRRLLAEADGNPLALCELPLALTEPQRTGMRPLPTVLPLSGRLRTLHGTPTAALPAATRWPLLVAALEGTGDLDAVAAVAGEDGLDHLAAAERAGLVLLDRGARRLAFRHPLVRSAVVDGAPRPERRRAHRALADGLAHDPRRRTRHLADAAGAPDEAIADLVERTARLARRRGDGVGAVAGLLRAADLGATGRDRARRLAEAAWVGASVTGDLERLEPLLVEAGRADPTGPVSVSTAVASAWRLLHGHGDVHGARSLLLEALADGRTEESGDVVDEARHVALEACLIGGVPERWRDPRAARDRPGPVSPDLELLAAVLTDPGRVTADDLARLDRAIRVLWTEPDPTRIVRIASAALVVGRGPLCRAALWKVVDSGREGGAVTSAIRALSLLCADDVATGRWDECVQLADEGLALCADHGYRLLAAPLRLLRALVGAARGDLGTATALVAEVEAWAGPRGNRALVSAAHRVSALAALADGDPDRAHAHASAVDPTDTLPPHDLTSFAVALDLVEAARGTGHAREAARHARALRRSPLAALSPHCAMLAAGAQAIAASSASPREATALFEEALAGPDRRRWAFDHARIQLAYGGHLRRHRETGPARRHLADALATFRRLSAHPWTTRAREELRAVGRTPEATEAAPADPTTTLTPEEHQVASLAASGLTNKQIGQQLHLSHRTVSARLYRAFPKLGVTSRAALRDALTGTSSDRPGR